jgi:hypothetical protein
MDPTHPRAVFLSFAREDTDAARRLAEALRGGGVEVWFDQGEARDRKIRQQIKNCGLFVPIVSRHTQESPDGDFRLEWQLAVERARLIPEGKPFLAPVALDKAHETNALVPAEFMSVQWIRLPQGQPTREFTEQVKRLLDTRGKTAPTRGPAPLATVSTPTAPLPPDFPLRLAIVVTVVGLIGVGIYFVLRSAAK